jgi:hypothetical protein
MTVEISILLLISSGILMLAANSRWLTAMDENEPAGRTHP